MHILVAAPFAGAVAQIDGLHLIVRLQFCGRAAENDLAVFQHIGVIRQLERHGGALFHQQDGKAQFGADLLQTVRLPRF